DDNALGHYAAWQISCVANRQIQVGDDLVFPSNSWKTSAACGQSGISSNNFKGWFHNSTDGGSGPVSSPPSTCSPGTAVTTFSQSQWINSAGGNAIGQESADIAKCDSAFNNHVPMFIPIMDFASGNGSNLQMHVAGFVGLIPDQLCSGTPPYTDWSGRVVAFSNFPDGKPCTGPGCPPPTGFEPVNFGLVR